MTKISKYCFLPLTALAALALSCARIEPGGPGEHRQEIEYQVVSTRASIAYDSSVPFFSCAWYLPDGKNWADDKDEAVPYIPKEVISFNGSSYKASTTYYWPKAGSLSFRAFSPASLGDRVTLTKEGVSITGWNPQGTDKGIDIQVAQMASDKTANETSYGLTGVPVTFRHMLSRLKISANIQSESDANLYKITGIQLIGIYTVADFSDTYWTNKTNSLPLSYTPKYTGYLTVDKQDLTDYELFIPQALTSAKLRIEYTKYVYVNEKTGYKDVAQTPVEVNLVDKGASALYGSKSHEFIISFGKADQPIDFTGSVVDWGDAGDISDVIIG